MHEHDHLSKAMLDPRGVFASPTEVLSDRQLSRDQKIEVLRRWAYEAEELGVAEGEGMPGNGGELLQEILSVLHQLAGKP